MIIFTCPQCRSQSVVSEARMGMHIRCRRCQEVSALADPHCKPQADAPAKRKATADQDVRPPRSDRAPRWSAVAIEGAVPGSTAGVMAGMVGGTFHGGDAGTVIGAVLLGSVLGFVIGVILGGLASLLMRRTAVGGAWERYRAPLATGLAVGLLAGFVAGGISALPWSAATGMLTATLWPLLGKLIEDQWSTTATSRRGQASSGPDDEAPDQQSTAHYINPADFVDIEELSRRKRGR